MCRSRNLILGLLATLLCADVHAAHYSSNMFLNGQYQNGLKTKGGASYSINPSNIFLEHAIISRQAQPFRGPTYLPPIKCENGKQCVLRSLCLNGVYQNRADTLLECGEDTVCCRLEAPRLRTTTPPPRQYDICDTEHGCVSQRECSNGQITSTTYIKKDTSDRCYAPEVCCRLPSTTLTTNGYTLIIPKTSFLTPTTPRPTIYQTEPSNTVVYTVTTPRSTPTRPPRFSISTPATEYLPVTTPRTVSPRRTLPPTQPTPPRTYPTQPTPPRTYPTQPTPPRTYPTQPTPPRTYATQPTPPRTYATQPTPPRTYPTQPTPPRTYPTQTTPRFTVSTPAQEYLPVTTPRARPTPPRTYPTSPRTYPTAPARTYPTPTYPTRPPTYPTRPTPPRPIPTRTTPRFTVTTPTSGYLPPSTVKDYDVMESRPHQTNESILPEQIPSTQIYPQKCASAMICTPKDYCNAIGVISETPVVYNPHSVPLTDCIIEGSGSGPGRNYGKCCRDSNYVDPWPVNAAGVCAKRNKNTKPKGIEDIDSNFAEIPWQAMILKESTKSLLCGGAIVGDVFVLTSASCVQGVSISDVRVKGGEWQLGSTSEPLPFQLVGVQSITVHPDYDAASGANDLAMIRLEKRFEFSTHIQPICISDEDPKPSEQCITSGWGQEALKIHKEGAIMHITNTNPLARSDCGADQSSVCYATEFDACELDVGSALACGSGSVVLKGIYSRDTACGEGQAVRFSKPDIKWINQAFADRSKPLLLLKRF